MARSNGTAIRLARLGPLAQMRSGPQSFAQRVRRRAFLAGRLDLKHAVERAYERGAFEERQKIDAAVRRAIEVERRACAAIARSLADGQGEDLAKRILARS